jgi:hypothetical protein
VALVIGSSFNGLVKAPSSSSSSSDSSSGSATSGAADNLSQAYGGITGDANICKDQNAFTGPDNPSAGT